MADGDLTGGLRVETLGVFVHADQLGVDAALLELVDDGVECSDRRGVPDAGIRQVDLDQLDLDGVVANECTRSFVDAKNSSPLTS